MATQNDSYSTLRHSYAIKNNTFSLEETESRNRKTVENSYKYLHDIQKSYLSIKRFTLSSSDVYYIKGDPLAGEPKYGSNSDNTYSMNGYPAITIDADIVSQVKRREFKKSEYYHQYFTLENLSNDKSGMFEYTPVVEIGGTYFFNVLVRATGDGKTVIVFNTKNRSAYTRFKDEIHVILFPRTKYFYSKNLTAYRVKNLRYLIPKSFFSYPGNKLPSSDDNSDALYFVIVSDVSKTDPFLATDELGGTPEVFLANRSDAGGLSLTISNNRRFNKVIDEAGNNLRLDVLWIKHINPYAEVSKRGNTNEFISMLYNPNAEDNMYIYDMPIPEDNVFCIYKANNTADAPSEWKMLSDIESHYPNFYKIEIDNEEDISERLDVYYIYDKDHDYLSYRNKVAYIYDAMVLAEGYSSYLPIFPKNYVDLVFKYLYGTGRNRNFQNFFNEQIWNFMEDNYEYSTSDFVGSKYYPHDFDYKVEKLVEFIDKDPLVLKDYAEIVSVPYSAYYLYLKDIDLNSRIRLNTYREAREEADKITFYTPHYVFRFNNDSTRKAELRFFVDGIFVTRFTQLHYYGVDYIYIPCSVIENDSIMIDVERFYPYELTYKFTASESDYVYIDIPQVKTVSPTLNDLFITDYNSGVTEGLDNYDISLLVDDGYFDKSDVGEHLNELLSSGIIEKDANTNEYYVNLLRLVVGMHLATQYDKEMSAAGDFPDYDETVNHMLADLLSNVVKVDMTINELNGIIGVTDVDDLDPVSPVLPGQVYEIYVEYILKYAVLNKIRIKLVDSTKYDSQMKGLPNVDPGLKLLNIKKIPYLNSILIQENGVSRVVLNPSQVSWKKDKSFIRTFINGRFEPIEFDIGLDIIDEFYVIPKTYLNAHDILTVDVSPFSYELVYEADEIPENGLVSFNGALDKPFSTKYYDIYLNGRKLSDNNIAVITWDKIVLYNTHSIYDLKIYKRDRDVEYYGKTTPVNTMIDDILIENDNISESDINTYVKAVVNTYNGSTADNTERRTSRHETMDDVSFEKWKFYLEVLLDEEFNEEDLTAEFLLENYPLIYAEYYDSETGVLLLNPNTDIPADIAILIDRGWNDEETLIDKFYRIFGNENKIHTTVADSITELLSRIKNDFEMHLDNGLLTASARNG